jgi:hypothetical protein
VGVEGTHSNQDKRFEFGGLEDEKNIEAAIMRPASEVEVRMVSVVKTIAGVRAFDIGEAHLGGRDHSRRHRYLLYSNTSWSIPTPK